MLTFCPYIRHTTNEKLKCPEPTQFETMGREMFTQLGSAVAGLMFIWAMLQQYFPYQFQGHIQIYVQKIASIVYPYIQIKFHENSGERFKHSEAYSAIETYLTANSSTHAKRLKAEAVKDQESLVLSMDDNEEVTDEFKGIKVWWTSNKRVSNSRSFSFYPASDEKRFYNLTFHKRHREIITGSYLTHVIEAGKTIFLKNSQRKLYTNCSHRDHDYTRRMWSHIYFDHPASFKTLAMKPEKKDEIVNDLLKFSKSKQYYEKIGKPWKRGYLLHGPPGTGKSTMIAAMANLLDYDIYDLELTAVKDNTELRRLLIETTSKAIIVIEDIDCSLDLTGQRKKKKEENEKDPIQEKAKGEQDGEKSKVTLSGLLNFIDGLWSACGGEKIIVFTTNYVEKLDPALIRRGRMDKHIELSYCCFEAFKVLAKNYLNLDSHSVLFPSIQLLLEETNMTPADVAENLMPKFEGEDEEACLKNLIEALVMAKEEARLKAEEEEKLKVEKERISKDGEVKENNKSVEELKENGEVKVKNKSSAEKDKENGVVEENGVAT